MLIDLFLSTSTLERMLKLRLLGEFRPIDEPITYKNQPCYLDGFEITSLTLGASPRVINFNVNNLNAAGNQLMAMGQPTGVNPVLVTVRGAILMATVNAVKGARFVQEDERYGLPDRPQDLRVPILGAEFDLYFTMAPNSVPTLNIALVSLPGMELLGDAHTFLNYFNGLTLPFGIGDAFNDFLLPGQTHMLNAGISSLGDGVVIRLEYEPAAGDAATTSRRQREWQAFFNGQTPSQLAGRDWAFDLPTEALVASAARSVDDQFNSASVQKFFTSTRPASVQYFPGWPGAAFLPQGPGLNFDKEGVIENACAGLDVGAEVQGQVLFSVPAPNTLRVSGSVDIDLNDWDSAKCTAMALINPLAGIITTVDWGAPWWAVFPISILLPLAPIAFGLGGDDVIVKEAIKAAQDKSKAGQPQIVRTSKTTFYADVAKQITTPLTRDWIVLQQVRGYGQRLVLAGDFTAPDLNTLPRLRGRLSDGFDFWAQKDRCSTNPQWVTVATLALELEDAASGQRVYHAPVPVRYGIDIETVDGKRTAVGVATWRILEDTHGIYHGPATRVHWLGGVPGTFEVIVEHPPEPFASTPYAFRLRFFTSMGVREFEIPAPPPVPKPADTREAQIAVAAERISRCYIFSSLLTMVKALQVFWLPTPQPMLRAGQHWQVLVAGLSQEDRLTAWDADRREVLAQVRPYNGGLAEISLVVPPGQAMRALQLTLNDAPLLETEEYLRQAAAIEGRQEAGPNAVRIRQTPLYSVAGIALDEPAEALAAMSARPAQDEGRSLRLTVAGRSGTAQFELSALDFGRAPRYTLLAEAEAPRGQTPSRLYRLMRGSVEGRAVTEIVDANLPDEERVVARYFARSRYDRGALAGPFFAQLDDAGTTLNVYQRGATLEAEPQIGPQGSRVERVRGRRE